MATCIRCGRGLPADQASCPTCGEATDAPSSAPRRPAEAHVPAGTWGEDDSTAGPELRSASPVLTIHEGGRPVRGKEPPSGPVPLSRRVERLEQQHRAADRTPLPVGALAVDEDPRAGELERTGTHRSPVPASPPEGQVVPLPNHGPPPRAGHQHRDRAQAAQAAKPSDPDPSGRLPTESSLRRVGDESSGPTPTEPAVRPRPPVLASEVLREDLEPTEPGRAALRGAGALLGVLGAAASLVFGGVHPGVLLPAACLAAIAAVCVMPLGYSRRAWAATLLALGGLAIASWARLERGAPVEGPVLGIGTVVLAGGLLFRARYRAARLARVAVAAGMGVIALWFVLAGGIEGLSHVPSAWQHWAPMLLRVGFALILLLSLLAFMGANSTGGAHVWGFCLLVWYAAHVGVQLGAGLAPADSAPPTSIPDPLVGSSLAAALLAVLGAMASSQAMAAACGGTVERRRSQTPIV